MAETSQIEWTDATWNPVTGCSVVSPGCTNCYAMKLAGTRLAHHRSRAGLTDDSKSGPVWNGQVRLNEDWLDQPLRWRRPRRIFVCAHGDLFHEAVPDEWIDRVFAVMALAPQHTFQVLTKRPARMRSYLTGNGAYLRVLGDGVDRELRRAGIYWNGDRPDRHSQAIAGATRWPLPNVWLGVSAEDQARADERIPELLATPAAVRFVSAEPLLGPVDLTDICLRRAPGYSEHVSALDHVEAAQWKDDPDGLPALDWVIVGGESGPGARPMHPDWARSLRDQCQSAGVPFFFKQWGSWAPRYDGAGREHPTAVGKRAAGRLLDGRTWDEMPREKEVA